MSPVLGWREADGGSLSGEWIVVAACCILGAIVGGIYPGLGGGREKSLGLDCAAGGGRPIRHTHNDITYKRGSG